MNSEFSPMEVVDGHENPSEEHYADIESRGYNASKTIAVPWIVRSAWHAYDGSVAYFLANGTSEPYAVETEIAAGSCPLSGRVRISTYRADLVEAIRYANASETIRLELSLGALEIAMVVIESGSD